MKRAWLRWTLMTLFVVALGFTFVQLGQWQLDRRTGLVDWFHALPDTQWSAEYWEVVTLWSNPALP